MSAHSIRDGIILRLNQVAQDGDIGRFYMLIQEDVHILEFIDAKPFVDTPLHIAASAGGPLDNQNFAMEMMNLMPSFARKLNPRGFSPIHLALDGGHTQMVDRLLQVDADLVRVKGKEGTTPLHVVAARVDQLNILVKFLSKCPNSIEDVTVRNQTAVHIALENNNWHAFKHLVSCLKKYKSENAREILNRVDDKGYSVLHMAVSKPKAEAVREILNFGVNFDARRLKDMVQGQGHGDNCLIRDMISYDEALSRLCSFRPIVNCYESCLRKCEVLFCGRSQRHSKTVLFLERFFVRLRLLRQIACEGSRISNDDRNVLLVVAALLITITYQVGISPPGGVYQEDKPGTNQTAPSIAPALEMAEYAGTSIGQSVFKNFGIIVTVNYFTFTLSTIMTFLLLPRGYISALFKMALVQLWVSYFYSLTVIIESMEVFYYCLISTGLCLVLVLLAFFGRPFCGAIIKRLRLDWIFYLVYACIMFLVTLVFVKED